MDRKQIEDKVRNFLIEDLEIDEDKIFDDARLKEDMGIDSLDFVDIVVIVEKNFGFKIKPEEMQGGSAGLVVVSMCVSAYNRLFCYMRSAQNYAHSETTTRQFVAQFPTLPSDKGVTLADILTKGRNKIPPLVPLTGARFRTS